MSFYQGVEALRDVVSVAVFSFTWWHTRVDVGCITSGCSSFSSFRNSWGGHFSSCLTGMPAVRMTENIMHRQKVEKHWLRVINRNHCPTFPCALSSRSWGFVLYPLQRKASLKANILLVWSEDLPSASCRPCPCVQASMGRMPSQKQWQLCVGWCWV